MLTRRQFQFGAAGIGAAAASGMTWPFPLSPANAADVRRLQAQPGKVRLVDDQDEMTAIWGYGGSVPGPLIEIGQGERLAVDLVNGLSQPTTVHWHGVRIDNAMDGVANLTQDAVAAGASFAYRFSVPDAGTYWYHPHNRTWEADGARSLRHADRA